MLLPLPLRRSTLLRTNPSIVGTGGFGRLFEKERLFDEFVPELPLLGLRRAVELAQSEMKK